jgi:hypothetical protein
MVWNFVKEVPDEVILPGKTGRRFTSKVYLYRDGAMYQAADELMAKMSGRPSIAKGGLVSRSTIGEDLYNGVVYGGGPKRVFEMWKNWANKGLEPGFKGMAFEASKRAKALAGLDAGEDIVRAAFYDEYRKLFEEATKEVPGFEQKAIDTIGHLVEMGAIKVEENGKLLEQSVLFADTGYLGLPPYLKTALEWYAEVKQGLPRGRVEGDVFYQAVDACCTMLRDIAHRGGSDLVHATEQFAEGGSFLAGGSKMVEKTTNPVVKPLNSQEILNSYAIWLMLRQKAAEELARGDR